MSVCAHPNNACLGWDLGNLGTKSALCCSCGHCRFWQSAFVQRHAQQFVCWHIFILASWRLFFCGLKRHGPVLPFLNLPSHHFSFLGSLLVGSGYQFGDVVADYSTLYIHAFVCLFFLFCHCIILHQISINYVSFQEIQDIRDSGIKNFRIIQVDESNILNWQGLIVPVSIDPM